MAYARTIHKFQGLSAGPVDKGKHENMFKCIVCDPDTKATEATQLGLLYTATSRATTLGDKDGLNSAIYFTGNHFNKFCILALHKRQDSVANYKLFTEQENWVSYLKRQEATTRRLYNTVASENKRANILKNIPKQKWSYNKLYHHLTKYKNASARINP